MIGVCPVLFVGWKILKRTKWHRLEDVDLFQNLEEIEEYQRTYVPSKPRYEMKSRAMLLIKNRSSENANALAETPWKGCWTGCLAR